MEAKMILGQSRWRRSVEANDNGNIASPDWNKSIDVLCVNCVDPQEPIDRFRISACIRSGIIAFAGVITAILALFRILRLHSATSSRIRLGLFYILFVHCIAGSLEWLLGWTTQVALFISYAKALELLIICYLYLDVASKMMHWSSIAGKRLCFSSLFLMFTYFTIFLIAGLFLSIEPWRDCHAPYWIWFSSGEFVMVQLIVGSFLLILWRMNRISAAPNIRSNQRRSLFSLFWTFETSALADLGYHIGMFLMADDVKGCSGVFDHDQLRYSLLKFPYDVVSFLMPAWAILFVFRTASKSDYHDDHSTEVCCSTNLPFLEIGLMFMLSFESGLFSIKFMWKFVFLQSFYFSRPPLASVADIVVIRNWRRRYRPLNQVSCLTISKCFAKL
ncbi:unnamed protein product [Angiostrongylus costaricensis]|uniref:G_PROTEIN_RECEP_F2_4 domain-containing protein n=1 Tax=Angiostrongylus costaricensis TaxID=334426 RepID=A0A0R3Q232_ANGCS|nr:unnamed protein product [Angiostrongylus costaricensis]